MKHFLQRHQALLVLIALLIAFGAGGVWLLWRMTFRPDGTTWRTDFGDAEMRDMVDLGGRDSVMPINHPRWMTAREVTWLGAKSPVIVVTYTGGARAYPIVVLIRHGIVNDRLGDTPIAVTYCALCNAPIVYERTVQGDVLRFAVTGAVRNSGLTMWDDLTESWWQQFTGIAFAGAYQGVRLNTVPSQVVGFGAYAQRYPNGKVLTGDQTSPNMSYTTSPFVAYDSSPQLFMYDAPADNRLFPTERVLAAVVQEQAVAYPFSVLETSVVVNDSINGTPVLALWQMGANSAHDRASVDASRDVGMAALFARMVNGQTLTFLWQEGRVIDAETGSTWNIFGEATDGALKGAVLPALNATSCFWFAWAEYYPNTTIYAP